MSDRKPANPLGWADHSKARKEEFAELLNTPAFEDVFNEKYVEGLERRRDFLLSRSQKIQVILLLISVVLVVGVLSVHVSFSLFGISAADARNLREILLVISFTLLTFDAHYNGRESIYINEFFDIYISKLSKGNDVARRALQVRYGLGVDFMMIRKFAETPSKRQVIIILLGFLGWILVSVASLFLILIATMVDIIINPTISLWVSILVVVYCIFGGVVTFGTLAFSGVIIARQAKR